MITSPFVVALLGLTPVAIAGPLDRISARDLEQRQADSLQALQASINEIGTQLAKTNNTVSKFKGGNLLDGIKGLTEINSNVVDLGKALTTTTDLAKKTAKLNATDSTTIGVSFLNLQPNINLLLTNLQSKRADLDGAAAGLLDTRSLIHDSLAIQQTSATSLGTSLIGALDPSLTSIAQPINDQIQGNFTSAVSNFKGRSGVIKIPTALVPTATDLLAKIGPALTKLLPRQLDVASAGEGDIVGPAVEGPAVEGSIAAAGVDRAKAKYCCGITQAQLDALGPNQNDMLRVPPPVIQMMKSFGII